MSFFADQSFDASRVAPATAFKPLPEGTYKVHVKSCAEDKTKDGAGLLLHCVLAVVDGEFKARQVHHRITLKSANKDAHEIGQAQLSALCRATGIIKPKSAGQFIGKLITVLVKVEKRKDNGELTNRVSGIVLPEAAAAPAPAPAAAAAPAAPTAPADDAAPWG